MASNIQGLLFYVNFDHCARVWAVTFCQFSSFSSDTSNNKKSIFLGSQKYYNSIACTHFHALLACLDCCPESKNIRHILATRKTKKQKIEVIWHLNYKNMSTLFQLCFYLTGLKDIWKVQRRIAINWLFFLHSN